MAVRVGTRAGRRPVSVSARRRAARASLVASGVAPAQLVTTIDIEKAGPVERYFYDAALAAGFAEFGGDSWPCDAAALEPAAGVVFRDGGNAAVYRAADGSLICAHVGGGWFHVHAAGPSPKSVAAACVAFREQYPASYLSADADSRVPVTFWTCGTFGPQSRLRRIEASPWEPIRDNYTAAVRDELSTLMTWNDGPGRDGQLLLWQGPPGTGKTWALRALASEWASWAEFHYITDPDAFFVDRPSYMVDVLLADSYETIYVEPSGDESLVTEDSAGKWRVLILEDTGELLSADAREKYGQGLSRLLNVVDGMIGQGLRVLALVTTNDELGDLHPAVARPGRCASQIVFGPLSDEEARAWTGDPEASAGTIAELFALRGAGEAPLEPVVASACQCAACADVEHASDCAVHAAPAFAAGGCSCGAAPDPLLEETLALARSPLAVDPEPAPEPPAVVEAAPVVASAEDSFAARAFDVLERFASRPADPAPTFHFHLPETALGVTVSQPSVTVEAPPPVVVPAPEVVVEGAQIDVNVPEQPLTVNVAAAAPVVVPPAQVTVEVPPAAPTPVQVVVPAPGPRAVRVEVDHETGEKRYVSEEA